jgi:lysyl-tRNA synthetase class 2
MTAEWAEVARKAGFDSFEKIKQTKHTQLHQQLNGFRKKNNLDIPALKIEEVAAWYENLS